MLDCRIAANFIPYGSANTNKGRNKILRVNDLPARQAHHASLRITTTPACISGFTPGKGASFHRVLDTVRQERPSGGRVSAQERLANLLEIPILQMIYRQKVHERPIVANDSHREVHYMDLDSLIDLIGPTPVRCSLEPIILDDVDCGSYVRQTVEYAVEEFERVKSFVLLPKNATGPMPAILAHHQHAGQFDLGKSEVVGLAGDPDQAYGAELAERGYVVIAPDAIAFEERNWSKIPGQAEYYELASRLVRGQTLLGKVLHDVRVALDYLTTQREVDRHRMGFIGHSYGGRMAIWAAAIDDRIRAAVSNCGCVNYKNSLTRDAGIQMEFCLPGILDVGDVEDVLRLAAPCAVLIQAAADDKWSRGAQDMFDYARSAFPDGQLELRLWPGGHMFSKEMRKTAYAFLDRHLSR